VVSEGIYVLLFSLLCLLCNNVSPSLVVRFISSSFHFEGTRYFKTRFGKLLMMMKSSRWFFLFFSLVSAYLPYLPYFLFTVEMRDVTVENNEKSLYYWLIPVVHGSYEQVRFLLLRYFSLPCLLCKTVCGRSIDLNLLARRSRHYAETHYLKRGLNVHGKLLMIVKSSR
jgi:hypothetical protein